MSEKENTAAESTTTDLPPTTESPVVPPSAIPMSCTSSAALLDDSPTQVRDLFVKEVNSMIRYLMSSGTAIPSNIFTVAEAFTIEHQQREAERARMGMDYIFDKSKALDITELSTVHDQLSTAIAPSTPRAIMLLDPVFAKSSRFNWISTVPLLRRLMLVAFFSLLTFILLALSPYVSPTGGDIFTTDGLPLLVNLAFFVSAASLGACFSALFQANEYIVGGVFDPKFETSYWIRHHGGADFGQLDSARSQSSERLGQTHTVVAGWILRLLGTPHFELAGRGNRRHRQTHGERNVGCTKQHPQKIKCTYDAKNRPRGGFLLGGRLTQAHRRSYHARPASPYAPQMWSALFTRRMAICVFTGFSSGLPLYLLLNLLPAWLRTEHIDLKVIGAMALIQFPYTWKFLWSPFLDRYALPWLGRRRGWMLLTQIGLLLVMWRLGAFSPQQELGWIVLFATLLTVLSATQDIVLDAYRRELLLDEELGLGNAVHVNAYRIASLVPGALSLILADFLPWDSVFAITALFMLPGMGMTLLIREAVLAPAPRTLRAAVVEPFREFIGRQGWRGAAMMLAFLFFYKLGDSLCTALATPFYIDMGFSKTQIGLVAKNAGLWPAVIGALLGGLWMVKLGINRALWLFGIVQVLSIFGFYWLASAGHYTLITTSELLQLGAVIGLEALGVGLGTAAFVAFIARSTHPAYTATQFALFTSLAAVPRTFVNASAGWLVEQLGWSVFFLLCVLLAIPGMMLLSKVAPWAASESGKSGAQ